MTPPMTETRDAVARIAEDALNARRKKADWPPTKLSQMQADDRERWIADTASTLEALRPGSRFTVDGVECVVVRKDALDWLNGEGDSFERPDNVRGNFWWRGEFRRRAMLSACEEK